MKKYNIPLKVLVIEDNQIDQKILESMLMHPTFSMSDIVITDTFEEACTSLDSKDFDVIILDLNLPDITSTQTLVKLNKRYPNIAVVVNTGAYEEELGLETLSLGAQDFLVKGKYTAYALNKVLHYAVERKKLDNELKTAYNKLKDTQNQLIQSEKLKVVGGLASGVAHEVKNPLATILYGITYLENNLEIKDEKIKEVLGSIKRANTRASEIINGLLDFASLNELKMKKSKLEDVIDKAISLLNHECESRKININKQFDKLPDINIDTNRIEQVFLNLFLNSIYSIKDGGIISIKAKIIKKNELKNIRPQENDKPYVGNQFVEVIIEDSGCGIPEDNINKIFDPFFTTRRAQGGTGLGLAVCKNIMDVHNGEIIIENRTECGTRSILLFKTD